MPRSIVVAHAAPCASSIGILAEHEALLFLEPELFLELQWLIPVTALKWW